MSPSRLLEDALWDTFKRIWSSIEPHVVGHFVTVKNDQVRRRPLPIEPA